MNNNMMALCDNKILKLGRMIRYNNRTKIINESVAEHSTYVGYNVLKICSIYDIPEVVKYRALEMAVIHDIPETYTSDVPWNVKQKSKVLSNELSRLELEFIKEEMPEIYNSFKRFQNAESIQNLEGIIIKLADTISVVQYCEQEKALGNNSQDMMGILYDGYVRVERYIQQLENKLKENKNQCYVNFDTGSIDSSKIQTETLYLTSDKITSSSKISSDRPHNDKFNLV